MFSPEAKTPGLQDFVKAFQTQYKQVPGYHAAGAYAAAQVLGAAIQATNSLQDSVLRDYVASHEFHTVMGSLSWDANGRPKPGVLLVQWQNGQQKIIRPKEAATAQPIYPMPPWSGR